MIFDKKSNVTIVLTSCDRFPLLAGTLSSIDAYNTYPIQKIIIVEDSGNQEILNYIPNHWENYCEVIINNPKLGQIKSIDLAYSKVETEYIFHCEDDWVFYRKNFIEDSIAILEIDPKILQVWLRDFTTDVQKHYPIHSLGIHNYIGDIGYSKLESTDKRWKGFSFNPGVRRTSDYLSIAPFEKIGHEAEISMTYFDLGYHAVILDKPATEHIGWAYHIVVNERDKKRKKKNRKYLTIGFLSGLAVAAVISSAL